MIIGRAAEAQRTVIYAIGTSYLIEPGLGLDVVCWTTKRDSATIIRWWYTEEDKHGMLKTIACGEFLVSDDNAIKRAMETWKELQTREW